MERRNIQPQRLRVPERPVTRSARVHHLEQPHRKPRVVTPPTKQQSDRATLQRYLSRAAKKSDLLARSFALSEQVEKELLAKPSFFCNMRSFFGKYALSGLAVAVLIVAGYISFDTWQVNRRVTTEVAQASEKSGDAATSHQEQEGMDETPIAEDRVASYKVAADMPRAIYIDKINVKARTLPMGVKPDGSMQAPINIFDAGWFSSSAKPGEAGAVVIDAHASGRLRQGLFAYLDKLESGDMITIEKGDGSKLQYRVIAREEVPLEQIDMKKVLLPHESTTHGLNLITCSGSYNKDAATYDHRTVVYTEQL